MKRSLVPCLEMVVLEFHSYDARDKDLVSFYSLKLNSGNCWDKLNNYIP